MILSQIGHAREEIEESLMKFQVGDKVAYPNQGAGIVRRVVKKKFGNEEHQFYIVRLSSDSKLMIPVANADRVGLKPLGKKEDFKAVLEGLREDPARKDWERLGDWKSKYNDHAEKLKTGTCMEIVRLLKGLQFRSQQKSLSFKQKELFDRARRLLASQIAVVQGMPDDKANEMIGRWLGDEALADSA